MQQNTEFPRTCSLRRSWWRFVCCVPRAGMGGGGGVVGWMFSFVVCKMKDITQTQQTKPPASIRRLKILLITNFALFHENIENSKK